MTKPDATQKERDHKPNFSPPGWLVRCFDIELPKDLAERFQAWRTQECNKIPSPTDHTGYEHLHPNALIAAAVELFLENEIRETAFSLWQERGCPAGSTEADFIKPAEELLLGTPEKRHATYNPVYSWRYSSIQERYGV